MVPQLEMLAITSCNSDKRGSCMPCTMCHLDVCFGCAAHAEFIVLLVPAGRYTLTERLWIKRSRLVLRGAGSAKTVLYIPKSEPMASSVQNIF
jgi:hypothetical protein